MQEASFYTDLTSWVHETESTTIIPTCYHKKTPRVFNIVHVYIPARGRGVLGTRLCYGCQTIVLVGIPGTGRCR